MAAPALMWFRHDLRLVDNPALAAALAAGPVIPVFVWSPEEEGGWPPGAASRWWLRRSLGALDGDLRSRGSRLTVRTGPALHALRRLIAETGATRVYWNRRYEPAAIAAARGVKMGLRSAGVEAESFNAALLCEPWEVATGSGDPYRVFTRFWERCLRDLDPPPPLPPPARLETPAGSIESMPLDLLDPDPEGCWSSGLAADWEPGERTAQARAGAFLDEVDGYASGRDRPDLDATSRLSPHLHFGEVGPRQLWHEIAGRGLRADRFLAELGWREFAHHLLYHFPDTAEHALQPRFRHLPWRDDPDGLRRWQRGQTGFPLVDAGMRQLWQTGWMHNRVRMVAASFLVKDLLVDWREGARWFWDTLVDADLANNTLGWQWCAGCGADAAPFFRVFNPVLQAERFDPQGRFIARYVEELGSRDYPEPVVDHAAARRRALEAFERVRAGATR